MMSNSLIDIKYSNALIVQRGNYFLGETMRKPNGITVCKHPAEWKPNPNGSAVIISEYDTEKRECIGTADLFPKWDTVGIEKRIHERLALTKRNFPAPEELYKWIKEWDDRDIDICEICEGVSSDYDCRMCPIQAIKYEKEDTE